MTTFEARAAKARDRALENPRNSKQLAHHGRSGVEAPYRGLAALSSCRQRYRVCWRTPVCYLSKAGKEQYRCFLPEKKRPINTVRCPNWNSRSLLRSASRRIQPLCCCTPCDALLATFFYYSRYTMGNLLGAPVTEKETHTGLTDEDHPGGGLEYGVSSMQGWRVHMEDAHITESKLYAAECQPPPTDGTKQPAPPPQTTKYNLIDLPGHSLFAVFDGHGGTFAAAYSGRNLCRVLSRQAKFVEYAKFHAERASKEETLKTEAEKNEYIQSGIALLKTALCNAFVELDKEIACALKGESVADADQAYLHFYNEQKGAAATHNSNNNNSNEAAAASNPEDDEASKEHVGGASATPPAAAASLQLLEEEGDSGTTACIVMLTPSWVVCANAGDSRSVISRLGNKAVPLSYDHKPDDEPEERRIRDAGGYVAGGRVEGDLAVSRGLGDFRFKNMAVVMSAPLFGVEEEETAGGAAAASNNTSESQQRNNSMEPGDQKVSPIPDIIVQTRNPSQDEFIIVACDGIWDVQTNYEAVKSVAEMFQEGENNLGLICEEVCWLLFLLLRMLECEKRLPNDKLNVPRFVLSVLRRLSPYG